MTYIPKRTQKKDDYDDIYEHGFGHIDGPMDQSSMGLIIISSLFILMATIYLAIRVYHQKAYYMGYFKTEKKIRKNQSYTKNDKLIDNGVDLSKLNGLLSNKVDNNKVEQQD